jgi:hypothetical protein
LLLLVKVCFHVRWLNFEWFNEYSPSGQANAIGSGFGVEVGVGVEDVVGMGVVATGVLVELAMVVDVNTPDDALVLDVVGMGVVATGVLVEPAMVVDVNTPDDALVLDVVGMGVVATGVLVEPAMVVDVNTPDDALVLARVVGIHDTAINMTVSFTAWDRLGRAHGSPGRTVCPCPPVREQLGARLSRASSHRLPCLLRTAVEAHAAAPAITASCAALGS